MDNKHGSRIVPIAFGIIEIILAIIIAGRGSGFIRYLTSFIGGGLFIFGLYSLYLGIFARQQKIDEMTNIKNYPNQDNEKENKFLELEKSFKGDQETINFFKASWLTSRGNYYGQQKKYEQAKNDFNEAINLNHYIPAYIGLGVLYREMGNFEEALKTLKSAPKKVIFHGKNKYNQRFDFYNTITSVYLVMGNKKKALEFAGKALLESKNPLKKEYDAIALKMGNSTEKEQKEMLNNLNELIVELKKEDEIKKK